MWVSCDEAIAGAKRRLRTFASAPDPHRHARALQAGLAAAEDWPAADREVIIALGAWLQDNPPSDALRDRCAAALAVLTESPSLRVPSRWRAPSDRRGDLTRRR